MLDKLNQKLIQELQNNGRQSYMEIAKSKSRYSASKRMTESRGRWPASEKASSNKLSVHRQ